MKRAFIVAALTLIMAVFSFGQETGKTSATPAPAAGEVKRAPIFRPNKDQILQVQKILNEKKLYTGEADGKYNDDTRTGIKAFQKDNGLKETGTLNRATLEKFGVELTDKQKLIPVSPNSYASGGSSSEKPAKSKSSTDSKSETGTMAKSGDSKPAADGSKKPAPFRANKGQITSAQKMLRDGKMLTGGEDGKLDDATRDGLGKYQDANGLKVTKTLNAATLQKMGISLTDAQKANVAAQAAFDAAKSN